MPRAWIEKDLKEIEACYELAYGHLFTMWAMSFFHWDSDFSESALEEIYNQSYELLQEVEPGDKCLDGYYFDSDSCELVLYQTKWPEDPTKSQSASDAREITSALVQLDADLKDENPKIGDVRKQAVDALRQTKESNGRIILRNISGGKWSPGHQKTVEGCVPDEFRELVKVELLGIQELKDEAAKLQEDLKDKREIFKIFGNTKDPILRYPAIGVPGLGDSRVILMSGLSLAEQSKRFGPRLFDRNVRHFLRGNKVNKDLQDTLRDTEQRKSFWYGHNGITVLCDDFEVRGPEESPTGIELENPQIVNGCQTATSLTECFGNAKDREGVEDFAVLARVIKLEGTEEKKSEAAVDIAQRTNNQAAINLADLRANDKKQKLYQKCLDGYSNGWFYERKRGEYKSLSRAKQGKFKSPQTADRWIKRETYQQAWRSYTGTPAEAVTKKNDVWARGHGAGSIDLYETVFDENRRPADIVLVVALFDWYLQLWKVKRDDGCLAFDMFKGLKSHAKEIRRSKTLVATHSVALYGYAVQEAYDSYENFPETKILELIKKLPRGRYVERSWTKNAWKVLGEAPLPIMQAWSVFIQSVKAKDEETLYGALKKPDAFEELKNHLDGFVQDSHRAWFER